MNESNNKSKAHAIAAFSFGLTFWIPVLNMIFGIFSIYFGIKALRNIKKDPTKYGGKWLAVVGIILSGFVYITFIIGLGMCFSGNSVICSSIGFNFLA
jgi:uncharacterized membrane protein